MSQASTAPTSPKWPSRMRRQQASEYLREVHGVTLCPNTLAKLAVVGGGRGFRLDGRFPIYDQPILDAYAIARLGPIRSSTSDRQAA